MQIQNYDIGYEDEVWCVFDSDNSTNDSIQRAMKSAGDKIKICLSNPCFELWYLIHFDYFDKKISTKDLLSKLETHLKNYDKTKDYFDTLFSKRDAAIKNAKKLNAKHEKTGTERNGFDYRPALCKKI